MERKQVIIAQSLGFLFIVVYFALIFKTYTYSLQVQKFDPHKVTSVQTLRTEALTLFDSGILDSIDRDLIPFDTMRVMHHVTQLKHKKQVILATNGALAFFFWFSGIAFLFIWLKTNVIIQQSPKEVQPKLRRFFCWEDRPDLTMAFLSGALLIWLISNCIAVYYHRVSHILFLFTALLSSLNSAFFLSASIDFAYNKRPSWLKVKYVARLFQSYVGIFSCFTITILLSIFFNRFDTNLYNGINWTYLPDFIFSIPTTLILGFGLWHLFRFRSLDWMGGLVFLSMLLVLLSQTLNFFPNLLDYTSIPEEYWYLIRLWLSVGYKTTLVTLFLILVVTWAARQIELTDKFRLSKIEEHVTELDDQNDSMSRINEAVFQLNQQLNDANKELNTKKDEIVHRVKNSLSILHNYIDDRLRKYDNSPGNELYDELWKIKVRSEGILLVHEMLDIRYFEEGKNKELLDLIKYNKPRDRLLIKLYFKELSNRLKKAFGYAEDNFTYEFQGIDDQLTAKFGIAKDLGMVITELAINVNQHAYKDGEEKKIAIIGIQTSDNLIIRVEDEGVGEKQVKSTHERGHGKSIINEITSQHGANIRSVTSSSGGYTAVLEVPIKNLN